MDLLVTLLIFVVVFAIIFWIVSIMPLPLDSAGKPTARNLALCILGLIAIAILLGLLTGHVPLYQYRR